MLCMVPVPPFVTRLRPGLLYFLFFAVFLFPGRSGAVAASPPLPPLRVRPVAPDVFVPTMHYRVAGAAGPTAANGLLIRTSKGLVLVDAAWNAEQTAQLIRWAADSLHQRIRVAVLTHANGATPEGLAVLQQHRIRVYGSALTARRWHASHPHTPAITAALKPYTVIRAGHTRLELFFPGAGFSPDNRVVWLPRRKVLFAGELVREQAATTLNGSVDLALKQWPATLRTLMTRYRRARLVVPAHGSTGSLLLLAHTQTLLREATRHRSPAALSHQP